MGKNGEIYYVACHIIFDTIIINMDSSTEWAEQNLVGSLHCAFQNLSKFGLKRKSNPAIQKWRAQLKVYSPISH